MGNEVRLGADGLWRTLRLPRTVSGELDGNALLRGLLAGAPLFIALWGLLWLCGRGVGTARIDLVVALVTALPLWIGARAWRLPWWVHVAAASLPLSIGVVALAHADPAGLVRGTKFAYGVILFLGITAWAQTSRRRLLVGTAVALIVSFSFFLALSTWFAVASSPFAVMKGALDWHNQFAVHMLFGFTLGLFIAILARPAWAVAGAVCASICGAGVLMSGSRYGLILGIATALAGLAVALVIAHARRRWIPLASWSGVVLGALAIPVFLRSTLFFPATGGAGNPVAAIMQRGGLESSLLTRLDWWRAAWEIGLDHPLAGAGLLTFDEQSVCYDALPQWHPHNEWAYAWAEGGFIALAPLLAVALGAVLLVLRSVPALTVRGIIADPVRWGALVALVVAIAHLGTEYDLYYPMLVALTAITAGVGSAPLIRPSTRNVRRHTVVAWVGLACALLVAGAGLTLDPTFEVWPWPNSGYGFDCVSA